MNYTYTEEDKYRTRIFSSFSCIMEEHASYNRVAGHGVEPLSRFVTDCHRFPPDDRPVIISDSRERLNELERFFNSSSLPESVELGILPRYGTIGSAIKLSHARKFKS